MNRTPESDDIRTKLNQETSRIAWKDLQTFYARGHIVRVAAELDLLTVASELAADNAAQLRQWMDAGQVGEVTISDAQRYFEENRELWAVVLMPWVLIQDKP
ncbi:MAG: DUF2288 domain-containing protein [Hahellaceae bacterium]|nr:DUF2288 domain-containing protein [Hahellaceae bacterium]